MGRFLSACIRAACAASLQSIPCFRMNSAARFSATEYAINRREVSRSSAGERAMFAHHAKRRATPHVSHSRCASQIQKRASPSEVVFADGRFRSWQAASKYQRAGERRAIRASDQSRAVAVSGAAAMTCR